LNDTWTHAAARWMVRPLVGTGVTPNHLTTLRLLTGVLACMAIAFGTPAGAVWGGGLWIVSAFLDRADGELARVGNMMSAAGHQYDYQVDLWINSAFFLAAGIGLRGSWLGHLAPPIGLEAALAMVACSWLSEVYEKLSGPGVRTWNGAFGFHPDDALYLLGPFVWLHWLAPILVAAAVCSTLMAGVILVRLLGLKRRLARTSDQLAI
jgi:archaetidylinositol phosphate synthase